jgi:hypothetical protein
LVTATKDGGEDFTFQYISPIETITRIVEDGSLLASQSSSDGLLRDLKDGSTYRNNNFFQQHPEAYTILLQSDALELANALGPRKGVFKVVNVYMTLAEIPKHLRSKTENLFLVLTVKESDLKNHRQEVYEPMLRDFLSLEEGVIVNGKILRAGLLVHLGDNLEVNNFNKDVK